MSGNDSFRIGKITIDGTGNAGNGAGVYIQPNVNSYIGQITANNTNGVGVYGVATGTTIGRIVAHHNLLDGVRWSSGAADIGQIVVYSNAQRGVQIMTGAAGSHIGEVISYSNTQDNLFVDTATDVAIDRITTYSGTSWGVFLNNCTRFRNKYMRSYSNVQGLRYIGNTDCSFGDLYLSGNSSVDIALSGTLSGFTVINASYSTISGGALTDIAKYKSFTNVKNGNATKADADVTLTVGTDSRVQRFGTTLTADRTITLATTGAINGDNFRIVRTSTGGGAFNLNVGAGTAIKVLGAINTWCDVEYTGAAWVVTASGSL
jgi:hypothetical protein